MAVQTELAEALKGLLKGGNAESVVLEGAKRQITLRNIPHSPETSFLFGLATRRRPVAAPAVLAAGPEGEPAEGASGVETVLLVDPGSVEGVASSTSQDWYGTEMSLQALNMMVDQCKSAEGVILLPTHGNWMSGRPEWDAVIGQTIDATITRAEVAEPYNPAEVQYIMTVTSELLAVPKACELAMRIDAGQKIGQSIGGWFTELQVIYDEDKEYVERIIVLAVHLDHIAVTRMPANPDSIGLTHLRSKVADAFRLAPRASPAAPSPLAEPAPGSAPASNRAGVTDPNADGAILDTRSVARDDTPNPTAGEPAPVELDMTPEQIAELISRSIADGLKGLPETIRAEIAPIKDDVIKLRAEFDAYKALRAADPVAPANRTPDATIDPAGKVETDRIKLLEAELADTRRIVATLAEMPQRRGLHDAGGMPMVSSGPGADLGFRSLVDSCRAQKQGTALAAVVERHIAAIAEVDGPQPETGKGQAKRNLLGILAAGLRAAEADGLLGRPAEAVGWA